MAVRTPLARAWACGDDAGESLAAAFRQHRLGAVLGEPSERVAQRADGLRRRQPVPVERHVEPGDGGVPARPVAQQRRHLAASAAPSSGPALSTPKRPSASSPASAPGARGQRRADPLPQPIDLGRRHRVLGRRPAGHLDQPQRAAGPAAQPGLGLAAERRRPPSRAGSGRGRAGKSVGTGPNVRNSRFCGAGTSIAATAQGCGRRR